MSRQSSLVSIDDNQGDAKKFVDWLLDLSKKQDDIRMQILALYNKAEDQGLDRKALKAVVKHKKKELNEEFRNQVNKYLEDCGDLPLFAVRQ